MTSSESPPPGTPPMKEKRPLRRQPEDHHFWSLKMLAIMAVAFLLVVWVATAPRSQREATFQAVQAPPRGYSMVRGLVPPLHLCFQPPAHKRRRCCKGGARA